MRSAAPRKTAIIPSMRFRVTSRADYGPCLPLEPTLIVALLARARGVEPRRRSALAATLKTEAFRLR